MKIFKRTALLLLAMALVFAAVSCGGGGNTDEPCVSCVDADGNGKCDTCKKDMPKEPVEDVLLFDGEDPTFQIIVAKDLPASVKQTVNTSIKMMLQQEYGARIDVAVEGSADDRECDVEILIGEVNSRGDRYAFDGYTLGMNGYVIKSIGQKIIINAGSVDTLIETIKEFASNFLDAGDVCDLTFTEADFDEYIQDDYYITSLSVNGNDMKGYTIAADITRDYFEEAAYSLRDMIYERTGYYFKVVDVESATDKSIVLKHNKSLSDSESYKAYTSGTRLIIECAFDNLLVKTTEEFSALAIFGGDGDVDLKGDLYKKDISVVYYEDFDAVGDGRTDDFKALYDTHVFANISGQTVKGNPKATYYIFDNRLFIGNKTQVCSIPIKTNTDWQGCKFIIDDTNVPAFGGHENSNLYTSSIFKILPDEGKEMITIKDKSILAPLAAQGIDQNTTKIDFKLDGWDGGLLLIPYNSAHTVFRRKGYGQHSGEAMHELIKIDADGNVSEETPIMFLYSNIDTMEVIKLDRSTAITVKNATIETLDCRINHMRETANGGVEYYTSYKSRGIMVNRSYTTVENIKHIVSGGFNLKERANGYEGAASAGMFQAADADYVIFKNCIMPGRQNYGKHSSYNLKINEVNKIILDGCVQSNFWVEVDFDTGIMTGHTEYADGYYPSMSGVTMTNDLGEAVSVPLHWGLGGTNYCKNMEYMNSMISRYDAHAGLYNGKIINTSINGMELTGVGDLVIENIKWYQYGPTVPFLYLRSDYGYHWDGDITVKDCEAYMYDITSTVPTSLNLCHYRWSNWYFGYTCAFPNVTLDNFDILSLKKQAPVAAGFEVNLADASHVTGKLHITGDTGIQITLDYKDSDGDGYIDEPLFDINRDGVVDENDLVDLDGNGNPGNTDLLYADYADDPDKTKWSGYLHPTCKENVNVIKPPRYFKVINNDGVNGSGGYVYKIYNTARAGYSDGGWYRDASEPDTFGGFFGNTYFIYGEGENDYLYGSNHSNQTVTSTFKFV